MSAHSSPTPLHHSVPVTLRRTVRDTTSGLPGALGGAFVASSLLLTTMLSAGVAHAQPSSGSSPPSAGTSSAGAPSNTAFAAGQKVEAREGDTWSPATVLRREGRRYLVKYEGADALEEWVTPDRLRPSATSGAPPAPDAAPPAAPAKPAPAKPDPAKPAPANPAPAWAAGQKVGVKWGGLWRDATITNRRDEWYLVTYSPGNTREWVEPWRIRRPDSTEDNIGYARPNPPVRRGEGPPSEKPGPAPEAAGARRPDANPGAGPGAAPGAAPGAGPANTGYEEDPAYKKADLAAAELLDLTADADARIAPDPAPADGPSKAPARAIPLRGAKGQPFEAVRAVAVSRAAPFAFVAHVNAPPGPGGETLVEKLDLASGRSVALHPVKPGTTLLDASPDGDAVLIRSDEFGLGKHDRLELWSLTGATPQRTLLWLPYHDSDWTGRDVTWAAFVDPTHVATLSRKGRLALWDVSGGNLKPVYTANLSEQSRPALSAGGKFLAAEAGQTAVVLDALTGKALAELPLDVSAPRTGALYAFSPSGKRLACWHARSLTVWDLPTGKVHRRFSLPLNASAFALVGDDDALLDGVVLVDLERRIPLWKFDNITSHPHAGPAVAVAPAGRVFFAVKDADRKASVLAAADLPHRDAQALAQRLGNADDLMLLKPGVRISLEVNLPVPPDQREQVLDALKQKLQANGLVVADNQPVKLIASAEPGKSEERMYEEMGGAPWTRERRKITITPQICKLRVESDGKTAWEAQTTSGPGPIVSRKQGQSMEAAIAEASKPNLNFFKTANVPAYLPKPRDPAWHGSSTLTARGVQ